MPGCPNHRRSSLHHILGMICTFQPAGNTSEFSSTFKPCQKHSETFICERCHAGCIYRDRYIDRQIDRYAYKACQFLPMSYSRLKLWPKHLALVLSANLKVNYYKIIHKTIYSNNNQT
jgi:hypothetical protein